MKVSRKIIITEINHKDLVNLFSTALTGSDMLGCDYDKDFWNGIPEKKRKGQCFEDHIADVLLNGGKVYVYDYYANGELHNEKGTILDDDENGNAMYELTLQDIVNGLQRTATIHGNAPTRGRNSTTTSTRVSTVTSIWTVERFLCRLSYSTRSSIHDKVIL